MTTDATIRQTFGDNQRDMMITEIESFIVKLNGGDLINKQ